MSDIDGDASASSQSRPIADCQDFAIDITCPSCISKRNVRFTFTSYFRWVSHLTSKRSHQKVSKILLENWNDEWNPRSLVIENLLPVDCVDRKTTKSRRKEMLKCFGTVNDLIIKNQNSVVMFKSLDCREKALSEEVKLLATSFDMRLKRCEEISESDWEAIIGDEIILQSDIVHDKIAAETCTKTDLIDQMKFLKEKTSLNDDNLATRMKIVEILQTNLQQRFPSCKLYPYGSFVTRLGDTNSDIDIFVDIEGIADSGHSYPSECKPPWIKEFSEIVKKAKDPENDKRICHSINGITKSRVPFVHAIFHCNNTIVNCDLTFTNILGVRNTQLICFYMDLDPRVRLLLHVVRYWGQYHSLTSSTSLKNYALVLLVLVFLARKGIVPTIYELQNLCEKPQMVNNRWNSNFCRDKETIKVGTDSSSIDEYKIEMETLQLAQGFFEEMSAFNFNEYAICTLIADYIPKSHFSPDHYLTLPDSLDSFKKWILLNSKPKKSKIKSPFKHDAKVVIQDPFDLSSNVGLSARKKVLTRFLTCCTQTSELLKNMLSHSQSEINLMDMFQRLSTTKYSENIPQKSQETPMENTKKEKVVASTASSSKHKNVSSKLSKNDDIFLLISKSICDPPDDTKFKTGVTFNVGDEFLQVFKEAFDNSEYIPANYIDLTNRLWICFALEFLDNVWKCFTVDIIDHKLIVHGDSVEKIKNACVQENSNLFIQYVKSNGLCKPNKNSRDCISIISLLKKASWLVEKDVVTVIRCQLHQNVWAQRSAFEPLVNKSDGNNPLGHEWEITQHLLQAQDPKLPGRARFSVGVKVDYDNLQCHILPAVHLVFKMENSVAHSRAFNHLLKLTYPNLLSKYATFRLSQMIND